MSNERILSIWNTIENTPDDAENMKARAVDGQIKTEGWSKAEAAKRFGVMQPRRSDLMRGKIDLFSIDTLVNMIARVRFHVSVDIRAHVAS